MSCPDSGPVLSCSASRPHVHCLALRPCALWPRVLPRPKLLCSAVSSGLVPSHAIRSCVLLYPQALYVCMYVCTLHCPKFSCPMSCSQALCPALPSGPVVSPAPRSRAVFRPHAGRALTCPRSQDACFVLPSCPKPCPALRPHALPCCTIRPWCGFCDASATKAIWHVPSGLVPNLSLYFVLPLSTVSCLMVSFTKRNWVCNYFFGIVAADGFNNCSTK